jgi:hypothetical protein
MHVCECEEVMFVSDVYAYFVFLNQVVSTSADTLFKGNFSGGKRHRIKPGTKSLQFGGWRKPLLFVLACCLMIATSGCGSGVSKPVGGGLVVSPNAVNFGDVPVGHEVDSSVNVTNSGSSPITISQVNVSGQAFSLPGNNGAPISIPAGDTYTLKIGFTPVSTTNYSGQITLMDTSGQMSVPISIQGEGSSLGVPQLTVSAATLTFGGVAVNTSTMQLLTLTSTGTSAVTVNAATVTGAGFTIVGVSLPVTLSPAQSLTLQVQFDPTVAGTASGQITINSNSDAALVNLSGTGITAASPGLAVSAASLSFGSVTVNTATTQSLTLTPTGTSAVTVNAATVTGAGFTIVASSLPVTLNPAQSLTLQVQFDPTTTGAASGQITINSNSGAVLVDISGTGVTAASPRLAVSAASLSFGSVTVNTATTQSLMLTSTGTSAVTVSAATATGAGFTIVAGSLPITLNPAQSLTLQVQFDPTTTGAASGQITVSSNSSNGSTTLVTLGGTGTAANPKLTISSGSLNFGSVAVNTATTQSLTLTSTGTTPVTVSSAAITGAGFTIVGGAFPVTLNPMQTLTLQLQFKPATAGALTGQLTIASDSSSGTTAGVALSGTGTAAVVHGVDLSWNAPTSSSDPVAGYNIYRLMGTGSFVLINSSPDSAVAYGDSTVVSGATYSYEVKSVDASGVESAPSNQITLTIP